MVILISLILKWQVTAKTRITVINGSEIFAQYRPILADTDANNSQNETSDDTLDMEISAELYG